MKKKRRISGIIGGVLAALVLLVVFLPAILSLGPVRKAVMRQANNGIDGTLTVKSWSLSWLRGPLIEGIEFSDGKGTQLTVESVELTGKPLALFGAKKDFGELTVLNPELTLVLSAEQEHKAGGPKHGGGGGRKPTGPKRPVKKPAAGPGLPDWDAVCGVRLEGGRVNLVIKGTNGIERVEGTARLSADIDLGQGVVALDSLVFDSRPVMLSSTGTVTNVKTLPVLDAGGRIRCDFARISELVAVLKPGTELDIEGDEERDFSVHVELGGQGWVDILRTADVQARLYIKRMAKFGIDARDFDAVLEVRDGRAQATLKTSVNDGEMLVVPLADVNGERPQLLLPDDSQLLKGVKVNDAMLSELLALIHPVLRGCAVGGGRMDMSMARFGAPLDETFMDGVGFNGAVVFRDLELGPGGLLKDLMSAAKLDGEKVAVPDQEITFKGENGRITPSPLVIETKGYRMTLSGSVGLDQSLDYVATVPVTRKMVSEKVYKYVKNSTIELHVAGTVTKPVISRESMNATLRNLVAQATKNLVEEKGEEAVGDKGKKLIDDLIKDEKTRKKAHKLLEGLLKQAR